MLDKTQHVQKQQFIPVDDEWKVEPEKSYQIIKSLTSL